MADVLMILVMSSGHNTLTPEKQKLSKDLYYIPNLCILAYFFKLYPQMFNKLSTMLN